MLRKEYETLHIRVLLLLELTQFSGETWLSPEADWNSENLGLRFGAWNVAKYKKLEPRVTISASLI
jgi:hypothetical protein